MASDNEGGEELRSELQRAFPPGSLVGPELGRGGAGRVFRAERPGEGPIAVKVLRPELGGRLARERFLREVQLAARISHSNIVPVIGWGQTATSVFLCMPLLEGGTLRDRLRKGGATTVAEALRVAHAIASALDEAAGAGIVHRDVKPENILFAPDGTPLLSDFGIAKAVEGSVDDPETYSQLAIGTPAYMSPEQHAADGVPDPRSDQYALACVVYEMLTGAPPFQGATPGGILRRKVLDPMPSIRTVRPRVAPEIEEAVQRALSPVAADRYPSAGSFVLAMRKGRTVRRPTIWFMAAAVGVLALGGALAKLRPPGPSADVPIRVAVVPFEVPAADTELRPVGALAADWMNEGLARTGLARVVPTVSMLELLRSSSEGGPVLSAVDVAAATSAEVLVTGRVYRLGDSLQFHAEVRRVASGEPLGLLTPVSAAMENPMPGIAELRSRIQGLLGSSLDARLSANAAAGATPPRYEAYLAFSRGLERYVENAFPDASREMKEAARLDSSFVVPLLFASIAESNLGRFREADSLARLARSSGDALSPTHRIWVEYRLALLNGDQQAALKYARWLSEDAPGTKAVYNYAVAAYENGSYAEAIVALRSLDPAAGAMRGFVAWYDLITAAYHQVGDLRAEVRYAAEARRMHPTRRFALASTIRAAAALGKAAEVERALADAATLTSDPRNTPVGSLWLTAALEANAHGHAAMGRALARKAFAAPAASTFSLEERAALHVFADEPAQARRTLEPAYHAHQLTFEGVGTYGSAALLSGDTATAIAVAHALSVDTTKYVYGEARMAEARIRAMLAQPDSAISLLRAALREGSAHDQWLHTMLELQSLRHDPRYRSLDSSIVAR